MANKTQEKPTAKYWFVWFYFTILHSGKNVSLSDKQNKERLLQVHIAAFLEQALHMQKIENIQFRKMVASAM